MFRDWEIRQEFRKSTGGTGVAGYGVLGLYGRRDESGDGIEGHAAKLKRERDAAFSLAEVGDRTKNHTGRLRWE